MDWLCATELKVIGEAERDYGIVRSKVVLRYIGATSQRDLLFGPRVKPAVCLSQDATHLHILFVCTNQPKTHELNPEQLMFALVTRSN